MTLIRKLKFEKKVQQYLEHDFNHVLCSLVQCALMKHVSEPLKYRVYSTWRHLTQLLANLLEEGDGNLGTVISGILQQQGQDL